MKAIAFDAYGDHSRLRLADFPVPEPEPLEVRVRVIAAGLNAFDWHQYRGEPYLMRPQEGWRVKQPRIVGADFAGIVDAVGADVVGLAVGDRVMGEVGRGALGEFVTSPARQCVPIADHIPFEAAAATPMAGLTALQALRDSAQLADGERVLVWGASGGVGHMAVQIARILGAARVDTVCSARNLDMMRQVGADQAFAYDAGELPAGPYDVIVDVVCTRSLRQLKPLLSASGRVVTLGAIADGRLLGPGRPMLGRAISSKVAGVRHQMTMAKVVGDDLAWLAARLADASLSPVVSRTFSLPDAAAACAELERGHVAGKLVVLVGAA